ncbi:MAG: NigD-like protein [Dysgonamonadaceae bacterium]|nr:NigD-like protein [Dysgonamonadaceae bacterium]MDD4727406.1 NigD-like protein [Dysgonamonadaceae bacterium]
MFGNKLLMKCTALIFFVLSVAFACNDNDGYSLGDYRISIATVVPEVAGSYSLRLDNGDVLKVATSDIYYRPRVNQRVFVNYTLLSDKTEDNYRFIKVNDILNVLTKPVIELTEQNADSIGNDPIKVYDFWIGDNYLNVSFAFNYGGVKPHAINMVLNKTVDIEDGNTLEFEFRHNSYESPFNELFDGFASFDLRPFKEEDRDSVPITIKYKNWDGDKSYELMYKYNSLNRNATNMKAPNISTYEYN